MHKILNLSMLISAVLFGFISYAKAEDDVYINWSVINQLKNQAPTDYSEPLFPDVSKAPKTVATKPTPKKTVVKAPVQKAKPAPKVEPEVKVYVKEEPAIITADDYETPSDGGITLKTVSENMESDAASPTSGIAKEELPDISSEAAQVDKLPQESAFSVIETAVEEAPAQEDELVENSATTYADSISTPISQEPKLLVSDEAAAPKSHQIFFADDSAELTDDMKAAIDAVIGSFVNPNANKIAIYSYNYDNGEDVFRKKRLSLNRAVEVRSYLLGKGYKNYSIKVINITDDANKRNLVEIEELK